METKPKMRHGGSSSPSSSDEFAPTSSTSHIKGDVQKMDQNMESHGPSDHDDDEPIEIMDIECHETSTERI
jgi:hypothetical protein